MAALPGIEGPVRYYAKRRSQTVRLFETCEVPETQEGRLRIKRLYSRRVLRVVYIWGVKVAKQAEQVNMRFSPQLLKRLKQEAKQAGLTQPQFVRRVLIRYFDEAGCKAEF
jgi:predicted DNA binding CopG/RHH family protein